MGAILNPPKIPEPEPLQIEPREKTEAEIVRDAEDSARRRALIRRARHRGVQTLSINPFGGD